MVLISGTLRATPKRFLFLWRFLIWARLLKFGWGASFVVTLSIFDIFQLFIHFPLMVHPNCVFLLQMLATYSQLELAFLDVICEMIFLMWPTNIKVVRNTSPTDGEQHFGCDSQPLQWAASWGY